MNSFTPEELGQFLQQLIDRHRKDLSILLAANGVDHEPTPGLLVALFEEFGSEFTDELAKLGPAAFAGMPGLDHAEGLEDLAGKVFTVFQTIAGVKSAIDKPAATTAPGDQEPKRSGITTRKMLITGVVVVVVLTIIFFIVRRKT